MQGGAKDDTIERWIPLAAREPDRHKRADQAYVVQTMAELTGWKQAWLDGLEGFYVQESQLLEEWTAKLVQRGEKRGAIDNAVEFILDLLATQPGTVTPDLVEAIRAIEDQARLKELHRLAGRATSVEQFRKEAGL